MKNKCIHCKKEIGPIQLICDDCSRKLQESVDKSVDAEKEALLAEIKQAAAEEQLAPVEDEDPDARAQAVLGKYKVIMGKKGPMFYREGDNGYKLVSKNDVPEDIKEQLIESATKE